MEEFTDLTFSTGWLFAVSKGKLTLLLNGIVFLDGDCLMKGHMMIPGESSCWVASQPNCA